MITSHPKHPGEVVPARGLRLVTGGPALVPKPDSRTGRGRWAWSGKLGTAPDIRKNVTWLYNEYKRGMLLTDPATGIVSARTLTPDDIRAMVLLLRTANDVRKDHLTESVLADMQAALKKLEAEDTAPSQEKVRALLAKPAFQEQDSEELDTEPESGADE